jgi:hypothetical protein
MSNQIPNKNSDSFADDYHNNDSEWWIGQTHLPKKETY